MKRGATLGEPVGFSSSPVVQDRTARFIFMANSQRMYVVAKVLLRGFHLTFTLPPDRIAVPEKMECPRLALLCIHSYMMRLTNYSPT